MDHAKGIASTEGKFFISMERFGNGEVFCCGKCARKSVEKPADVLVLMEDTIETQMYFLNQYLHLQIDGIRFDDFSPLDEL
jgi:hypothetical protein